MGRYKDYNREPKREGFDDEQGSERSGSRSSQWLPAAVAIGSSTARLRPTPSQVTGQVAESVGTVKLFKADKGFGFIGQDGGGKDVFVHVTALARAGLSGLVEGQRVRMQVGQSQKGLEARTIELIA